jgi:hypothetical protein
MHTVVNRAARFQSAGIRISNSGRHALEAAPQIQGNRAIGEHAGL